MFGKRSPPNAGTDRPDDAAKRRAAEALERARAERAKSASRPVVSGALDQPQKPQSYAAPSSKRSQLNLTGTRAPGTRAPGTRALEGDRKLVVGRDISLSGEIKACKQLVVEGQVSANLKDCEVLQISASGLYKGAAGVDQAEISGRFEGDLTVRGTLTLHATGRVSGTLRYGDMEIERGGKIIGTLEEIPAPGDAAHAAAENRPKAAGKARPAGSAAKAKDRRAPTAVSDSTSV